MNVVKQLRQYVKPFP